MFTVIKRMRTAGALFLSAALLLALPACGEAQKAESSPEPSAEASIEAAANRGYIVTIPESVLKRTGVDIPAVARKLELGTVTMEDDGSCTVQMTEEERDTVLAALRKSLDEQLAALPESGTWPFLDGVSLDKSCKTVTLQSEAARYSPIRDNAVAQSVYIPALLYTAFSGGDTESFSLHFTVLDSDGKTTLGEFDYPEPEAEPEPSENGEPSDETDETTYE